MLSSCVPKALHGELETHILGKRQATCYVSPLCRTAIQGAAVGVAGGLALQGGPNEVMAADDTLRSPGPGKAKLLSVPLVHSPLHRLQGVKILLCVVAKFVPKFCLYKM